jgi:sugar O-acyltransferase (sialic acid O-acetyltransferase NeuD family)
LSADREKKVIILGAGGHARVLIDALKRCHRTVLGVLTPEQVPGGAVMGVPVLGDDSTIKRFSPDKVELVNGVGSYPGQELRWQLRQSFQEKGYRFSTVIHPQAIISEGVVLGTGVQIMAGCIVQTGVQVGDDTILNTGAILDHDCVIGNCCHIAPGCTLSGGVVVGNRVHVGTGSSVIQQITIGEGAMIGAGSVIFDDISPFEKVIQRRMMKNFTV